MSQTYTSPITSHSLGFPRIGAGRELKKALEAYWAGDIDQAALEDVGRTLRRRHWKLQADAGLDWITTGDFAWYDQVLTLSATVGNIPLRHRQNTFNRAISINETLHEHTGDCCATTNNSSTSEFSGYACTDIDLDTLFRVARGRAPTGPATNASDMTKWFDTNYHYLVPEFHRKQHFALSWTQIIDETKEAINLGYKAKPVIIGPLTYLWLGREKEADFHRLDLLDKLVAVYEELLTALASVGATWVQVDEPILVLDLPEEWKQAIELVYHRLRKQPVNILLATYFGALGDNLTTTINLPVAGLHIDLVRAPEQLISVIDKLAAHKVLSLGLVDGRNIWRNDLDKTVTVARAAFERIGGRLWLAPSCSLLHVPVDLAQEYKLPAEIINWLAFAKQKIDEVVCLKKLLLQPDDPSSRAALLSSRTAVASRLASPRIHNPEVQARTNAVSPKQLQRKSTFEQRIRKQKAHLNLPLFPTTSIGSFPQTDIIRKVRKEYKIGLIDAKEYEQNIRQEIALCIRKQEEIQLDVLVHGEAERNDMVEYFGEQLNGYAFTEGGWVQSYGSRCVKPPIIYGDVSRPFAMTVNWAKYAQSLSNKPVKGMLTGPITMLFWSFVRDDQPRALTAQHIALALRDEVLDLEAAGIRIIQIDEPAIREGLPLRKHERANYLQWAVNAFRLAASGVSDETQIHTHMCYSEFNDIIAAVADLDADVITIETSRSDGELLQAFEEFYYPNDIGPGVYDIHSPNVPSVESMIKLIERTALKIPVERLWVNPDCGLKTRKWPETERSLTRMVEAAKILRREYAQLEV